MVAHEGFWRPPWAEGMLDSIVWRWINAIPYNLSKAVNVPPALHQQLLLSLTPLPTLSVVPVSDLAGERMCSQCLSINGSLILRCVS